MSLSSLAPPSALTSATDQSDYPATLPLALLAFHRHVGPIFKGTDAKYGKFADLRTVLDAVTPPLLEQGLVLTQTLTAGPLGAGPTGADPLGAGAVTLLRTQLLHAPSGQELSSDLALPTLDTLLARLHDLRLAALNGFPFDLQLAAAGSIPLVLPPKSPAPAAAAPEANGNSVPGSLTHGAMPPGAMPPGALPPGASHQRQPGLRLDDQIKGFYGLQQSLGTTSNPLHSIGGAVTYFRRYAILAILSLAAEDNDGADYGDNDERQSQPRSRSRNQVAGPQVAGPQVAGPQVAGPQTASSSQASAPKPSPARNRRTVNTAAQSAGPQTAGPQTAPEPGASEPVAPEPVPPGAVPPEPVAPEPVAPGAGAAAAVELSPTEIQGLINSIRALPNEQIPSLVNVFREQFQLPVAALVSDYIRTREHAAFIEQRIQQLTPVAV